MMWHIPKRCSVDQTRGAIEILLQLNFDGKKWTGGRKETFNSRMGMAGLTKSGGPLSPSGRRTLEALFRYFGVIYVDNNNRLHITGAGYRFLEDPVGTFRLQMLKLQLTNPITLRHCRDIAVFPFRVTLRLLLDLEYLDIHEIGYILFFMQSEAQYDAIRGQITEFRALRAPTRQAQVEAYMQRPEGRWTLVLAPSARYYAAVCALTDLCVVARSNTDLSRSHKRIVLEQGGAEQASTALAPFQDVDTFDFADDQWLWIEYYGNPNRLKPPQTTRLVIV